MHRWMVTGAGGMLGTDLVARLARLGPQTETFALTRAELDLRRQDEVARAVRELHPDCVVNCAGWTAVDDAEAREDEALEINGRAVRTLAEVCAERGVSLIHLSTDYVFDGTSREPYGEGDPVNPVNAYGRTKLAGERAVLDHGGYVVRTAWLYGARGTNFVRTMARLAAERETVSVVDDQIGQPTWTADLADQIVGLGLAGAPTGIYHGTSGGRTSWCGLAREIFTLLGLDPARVLATTSDRFPRPARRPASSVLGHARWAEAGLAPMRDWRAALHAAWPALGLHLA